MSSRSLLATLLLAAGVGVLLAADPPRAVIPVTVGKDTTVVTGPLDKDGLIDYETAINERLRGKTTARTNALVALLKAIGPKPEGARLHKDYYKWLDTPEPPEEGTYLLKYGDFFQAEVRGEDNQAHFDREGELRTRPWTETDEPKFAEWVKANGPALKVVAEASLRPDYFYPMIARKQDGSRDLLIGALLSSVQKTREVAALLSLRVMYHCGHKRYDAAWQDVMTMHRLARLLSKGATLIELLVGIAIDAIAQGTAVRFLEVAPLDAKRALAYRDELAKLQPMADVASKVDLGDRFLFLDIVQHIRSRGAHALRVLFPGDLPAVPNESAEVALRRLDWDRVMRTGNRWYDRLVAALRKPSHAEREKELERLGRDLKAVKENADFLGIIRDSANPARRAAASDRAGDLFITQLIPAVQKVGHARTRYEVLFREEVLAFALAAYRADHKKYPAKLTDLVPKYAASIPDDVYSGKPLIYKPTGGGYELYSVGTNGKDDGGHMLQDDPPGDDFGIRMPRVKKTWPQPPQGNWPFPPGPGPGK